MMSSSSLVSSCTSRTFPLFHTKGNVTICMFAFKSVIEHHILQTFVIINVSKKFFSNFSFKIYNLLESQTPFSKKSVTTATRDHYIAQN